MAIYSIVPPYIYKKIAENGDETQKERANKSLEVGYSVRERRITAPRNFSRSKPITLIKNRCVFDANNTEELPGNLILNEGESPLEQDLDAQRAYYFTGETWDLFAEEYGRNSIDDFGMPLISCIHVGVNLQNAFYDGREIAFGDGDGTIFQSFLSDVDVCAHEIMHGITQWTCNLMYEFESGAINESLSDVFGSCVKQRVLKQRVDQADWNIGENILIGPYSLRSMSKPGTAYINHPILGTDPQPAEMKDFITLPIEEDHGGVHLNSSIPNRAFYLACKYLGGNSWETAGRIWYNTITSNRVRPQCNFKTFAKTLARVAEDMYGVDSIQVQAVNEAWNSVGVI